MQTLKIFTGFKGAIKAFNQVRTGIKEIEVSSQSRTADHFRDSGAFADAAVAYRRALDLTPDRDDLRVQLGNMLKDSGQLPEAEAAYRAALRQANEADTHLQLGHVLKAMGRRDAALAEYRQAIALDPNLDGAVRELAEAGDEQQARRSAEVELRAGGAEALLTISDGIARMRAELDRLARLLPEARARTAFPVAMWDTFRDLFPVPPPPDNRAGTAVILLLADREDLPTLFGQIAAISAQAWPHWRLLVVGSRPDRRRVVDLAAMADTRIGWFAVSPDLAPAAAERAAAVQATDWLLLLAPGAMLDPQALAWFAAAFTWSNAAAFICDEEAAFRDGARLVRSAPVLRQAADFDSLLDLNPLGETLAIRAAAYHAAAPVLFDVSVTAARVTLLLRFAARGEIGHVPQPLVWRGDPEVPAAEEHQSAVAAYLAQVAPCAPASDDVAAPIAVIIPTRDNAADLCAMVSSLRATAAVPDRLEIIVIDNGTSRIDDIAALRALEGDTLRVLRRESPFNWSELNNYAAREASAPLLVFANDDMRMVSQGWDERVRRYLLRSDVGAVGARLLYDDDTVQHAGVLLGWKGSVIHDGLFAAADDPGPTSRWRVTRAAGAVTGAFLAIRRDRFMAIGGFDATNLPVAYSDVDLCLRLRVADLKVIWTPTITLYHHESKSRGLDHADEWRQVRNAHERSVMERRWGVALEVDPGLHPAWHDATLPFRLLTSPSIEVCREHIIRTGSGRPWGVSSMFG